MSRRRLMGGKEYKYIKDARDVTIKSATDDSNVGNLFNNYSSNTSLNFEVYFTFRVNSDNAWYCLVENLYNTSNYWDVAVRDGNLEYRECYDGTLLTVSFSTLGKIEKDKWYTVGIYLPGNTNAAYCKINSDTYTKFTLSNRRAMSFSNKRAVYFGRNGDYGVDLRGELLIKGFSSNGTTQNIGIWNIDDMKLGAFADYANGSGGSPSTLKLSGSSNIIYLDRE